MNDGNTARKIFRHKEISSKITGVDIAIIKRFHVILEVLNSGFQINTDKLEQYAQITRELYVQHYSWYPMPVSVRKGLFHGKAILCSCILPIGQLSEDAQEAREKHHRKYRELFTRKMSRIHTNTDLLHRLLITSDPVIGSFRYPHKTKHSRIEGEVLALLAEPASHASNEHQTLSDDSSVNELGSSSESDV